MTVEIVNSRPEWASKSFDRFITAQIPLPMGRDRSYCFATQGNRCLLLFIDCDYSGWVLRFMLSAIDWENNVVLSDEFIYSIEQANGIGVIEVDIMHAVKEFATKAMAAQLLCPFGQG